MSRVPKAWPRNAGYADTEGLARDLLRPVPENVLDLLHSPTAKGLLPWVQKGGEAGGRYHHEPGG